MANKRPISVTPHQELSNSDATIAGQATVLEEQASSLATPSSGYGVLYAKTDGKLYYKNDAGVEFDLTTAGSGGTNPIVREYIANDTWTKPTAANFVGAFVICLGAGSGGGSGRRGLLSENRCGGGAGAGGAMAWRYMTSASLTASTYNIVVGSGGLGGASQTIDSTNGISGGAGGDTQFGITTSQRVIARGASTGGSAGTTAASAIGGAGGFLSTSAPQRRPFAINGSAGASGSRTSGGNPVAGFRAGIAAPGGGGGAGFVAASTSVFDGGAGGFIFNAGVQGGSGTRGLAAGNVNGGNGTDHATYYSLDIDIPLTYPIGGGGGGGASSTTVAGGNGGNGGRAAGGGGGAGSTNGLNSGAGGNGGNGVCVVIEYYGA